MQEYAHVVCSEKNTVDLSIYNNFRTKIYHMNVFTSKIIALVEQYWILITDQSMELFQLFNVPFTETYEQNKEKASQQMKINIKQNKENIST